MHAHTYAYMHTHTRTCPRTCMDSRTHAQVRTQTSVRMHEYNPAWGHDDSALYIILMMLTFGLQPRSPMSMGNKIIQQDHVTSFI